MEVVRSVKTPTTTPSLLRNVSVTLLMLAVLIMATGCETLSHERSEAEEVECLSLLGVGVCIEYNQPVPAPSATATP